MRKIARVNGPLGNQSSRFQNVILYIKKTKSKMDALCLQNPMQTVEGVWESTSIIHYKSFIIYITSYNYL